MEPAEVGEIAEEVVELANLAVLGEDEVGLAMQIFTTCDDNYPPP